MRPIHIFPEVFFFNFNRSLFFYSRSAQYQWLWNGVCFMVFTNRIGLQFKCSSGCLPLYYVQYMNFWHIWCIRIMQKSGAKLTHTHTTERWYRRGRGKQKKLHSSKSTSRIRTVLRIDTINFHSNGWSKCSILDILITFCSWLLRYVRFFLSAITFSM